MYIYSLPYTHTYIYTCIHTFTYTYKYIYACAHAHTYICRTQRIWVYTYIHLCVYMYTCIHFYAHIHIYTRTYTHLRIRIYTYTHAHTHTHMYVDRTLTWPRNLVAIVAWLCVRDMSTMRSSAAGLAAASGAVGEGWGEGVGVWGLNVSVLLRKTPVCKVCLCRYMCIDLQGVLI